jgi:hypothetical protein
MFSKVQDQGLGLLVGLVVESFKLVNGYVSFLGMKLAL